MRETPRTWGILLGGVLLLCVVAYGPSARFQYVQDSYHAVKINPVVERGSVVEIFTSDFWKDTISNARTLYRPLTVWSFALERGVGGESDSGVSHVVNVLLHGLAALLLFLLTRRYGMQVGGALVTALLFTTHPLLMQGVANVMGRSDLLALVFSLCALLAWTYAGAWRDADGSRLAAGLGGVAAFLAFCSKEIAVALPLLLVAQEALFRPRGRARGVAFLLGRVGLFAPLAIAAALYMALRTVAIGELAGLQRVAAEDNVLVTLDGVPRVATTLAMLARYAMLLVRPVGLSGDYSGSAFAVQPALFALLPLVGLALLTGLSFLVLRPLLGAREGGKRPAMAACLFLVPYLVVGNLIVLNGAGFAERLVYVPAAGFCMLVGLAWTALYERVASAGGRTAALALVLLCALGLGGAALHARQVSRMWRDSESFFTRTLETTPGSLRPYIFFIGRHTERGELDAALRLYDRALEHTPGHADFWMERGMLLGRRGRLAEAEESLRRAVEVNDELGAAHMYLGIVLQRRGELQEAERELRDSLALDPTLVEAAVQLGHMLYAGGRFEEAAHFYRGAVELGRDDVSPLLRAAERRARAGS
ncbi:MAG: tetratricopeptide repeat protein [bacterium]|nr:tetratricopeptide repeat protein [bacterium]